MSPVRPRRISTRLVLFVLFVVLPLAEVYVLVQVGQVIGAWWTIGLLLLAGFLGTWLIRREGGRAWAALRTALAEGRMPARELADGALVLIGGTMLLSPGFVTDAFAVLLLLPITRPVFRRLLARTVAARLVVVTHERPGPGSAGSVVRGEVVDDD
ncbi:FxsA family protein [Nocardioides pantholopis]|uniref:FxsA family protein n=1 Tax=Nocardioides pantholopis TaxID=2483798 RepID=UPI000F0803BC|nr:FxsA family protein [Nocardioides pantholopis]